MYANGKFAELLSQVDHLLESQPGQMGLLRYRRDALVNMGQIEAAKDTVQQALESSGHVSGQSISGDQLFNVVSLANVMDITGDTVARDQLVSQSSSLLNHLRQSEPANSTVLLLSAMVASIQNDLPGVLSNLELAVQNGFTDHWELIRSPVFARWQDNEEFQAFYQSMLKTAADNLREYKTNNPKEKATTAREVFG
jgi:hypothetical protein